jgi:hypothetical protein
MIDEVENLNSNNWGRCMCPCKVTAEKKLSCCKKNTDVCKILDSSTVAILKILGAMPAPYRAATKKGIDTSIFSIIFFYHAHGLDLCYNESLVWASVYVCQVNLACGWIKGDEMK